MLDRAPSDGPLRVVNLDTGYHSDGTIEATAVRSIEPPYREAGPIFDEDGWTRRCDTQYPKSHFVYDSCADCSTCPAGAHLPPKDRFQGNALRDRYDRDAPPACAEHARKPGCTL